MMILFSCASFDLLLIYSIYHVLWKLNKLLANKMIKSYKSDFKTKLYFYIFSLMERNDDNHVRHLICHCIVQLCMFYVN